MVCVGTSGVDAEAIRVGVAISLKDAIESIQPAYEAATGDSLELSFGASGQLANQIRAGAEIDLLISASAETADALIESKHARADSRRVMCGNTLVLIVPREARDPPTSFASLADRAKVRVAVGEPKSVPAGDYAMQVFRFLNLDNKLEEQLIFGTNVRQVLSYVERGEVAAGVVYGTDARLSDKVTVVAKADPSWHKPIEYVAVMVAASKRPEAAARFSDFLGSEAARKVISDRGFIVPSTPLAAPASQAVR